MFYQYILNNTKVDFFLICIRLDPTCIPPNFESSGGYRLDPSGYMLVPVLITLSFMNRFWWNKNQNAWFHLHFAYDTCLSDYECWKWPYLVILAEKQTFSISSVECFYHFRMIKGAKIINLLHIWSIYIEK